MNRTRVYGVFFSPDCNHTVLEHDTNSSSVLVQYKYAVQVCSTSMQYDTSYMYNKTQSEVQINHYGASMVSIFTRMLLIKGLNCIVVELQASSLLVLLSCRLQVADSWTSMECKHSLACSPPMDQQDGTTTMVHQLLWERVVVVVASQHFVVVSKIFAICACSQGRNGKDGIICYTGLTLGNSNGWCVFARHAGRCFWVWLYNGCLQNMIDANILLT